MDIVELTLTSALAELGVCFVVLLHVAQLVPELAIEGVDVQLAAFEFLLPPDKKLDGQHSRWNVLGELSSPTHLEGTAVTLGRDGDVEVLKWEAVLLLVSVKQ